MSFQLFAYSPKGERIKLGFPQQQLQHALEDRDDLRAAYLRKGTNWTVEVEDSDGVLMDWADVSGPASGEAA